MVFKKVTLVGTSPEGFDAAVDNDGAYERPEMSEDDRLAALQEHFVDIVQVHDELADQLDAARSRRSSS